MWPTPFRLEREKERVARAIVSCQCKDERENKINVCKIVFIMRHNKTLKTML